jgi:hypothetical protein
VESEEDQLHNVCQLDKRGIAPRMDIVQEEKVVVEECKT